MGDADRALQRGSRRRSARRQPRRVRDDVLGAGASGDASVAASAARSLVTVAPHDSSPLSPSIGRPRGSRRPARRRRRSPAARYGCFCWTAITQPSGIGCRPRAGRWRTTGAVAELALAAELGWSRSPSRVVTHRSPRRMPPRHRDRRRIAGPGAAPAGRPGTASRCGGPRRSVPRRTARTRDARRPRARAGRTARDRRVKCAGSRAHELRHDRSGVRCGVGHPVLRERELELSRRRWCEPELELTLGCRTRRATSPASS